MPSKTEYGNCPKCGFEMSAKRTTTNANKVDAYGRLSRTGPLVSMVDYLYCESCGHQETVDDSFDILLSAK